MPPPKAERRPWADGVQDAHGGGIKTSVAEDLAIARGMAAAGIPVFVAYPDPDKPGDYKPRGRWQRTAPNPAYAAAWKPGLALCAVMGHGLDLVDIDPRNGGDPAALNGLMPNVLGVAATPSGGEHNFVRSMGVRSRDDVFPGIDVKAGDPEGQGRGFAFIAPTVRVSKTTGEPASYRWVTPPDLGQLGTVDRSGEKLAALISKRRAGGPSEGDGTGWTDPDIDALIEHGIPGGVSQDVRLRDVVWKLRAQFQSRPVIYCVWQAIVSRTTLKDTARPWTGADFERHWQGADRKQGNLIFHPPGEPVTDDSSGPGASVDTLAARLLPGGCILDVPPVPAAVWGDEDDILWAEGQSLIIAGPDGVGKTTLAGNLIQARLGLSRTVLSLPVRPGSRSVLLLLMDRPQQAMAALARLFTKDNRDLLDARLVIWRGPPPHDLARHTGMLAHLCMLADADTCVIDSLKDAALKLSDDETGSGWNQARQIAIEAGTQLLELHHPRKAQEGNRKPRKLDDLYGSRWISAGAGSVISLWGQAGDPVVDLTHLKPVVTTAGPWQMNIDGETGVVGIDHGIDLVEQIRYRPKGEGITAQAAAKLLTGAESPGKAAIEKARRKLDRKVAEGLLVRHDGRPGGVHGGVHATWHLPPFTEAFTDRSRPGQAFTPTEEPPRSRTGGDISPPERERWSPGPRPGESPLGYAQRLRRERAAEARP